MRIIPKTMSLPLAKYINRVLKESENRIELPLPSSEESSHEAVRLMYDDLKSLYSLAMDENGYMTDLDRVRPERRLSPSEDSHYERVKRQWLTQRDKYRGIHEVGSDEVQSKMEKWNEWYQEHMRFLNRMSVVLDELYNRENDEKKREKIYKILGDAENVLLDGRVDDYGELENKLKASIAKEFEQN